MNKIYYLLLIPITFVLYGCNSVNKTDDNKELEQEETIKEQDSIYGIGTEGMEVIQDKIPNNKTLSDILSGYGVNRATIHYLAEKSKETFDVRKIRNGNNYCIIRDSQDSAKTVKYFVYEIDQINYITYQIGDSIQIQTGKKDYVIKERIVEGEITTSLWNAVTEKNIPFMLAYELSNIYAWNIDFFGLQKGDKFKVDYTEVWVDSTFIKIDTIKCAIFNHCGNDFHAIPFAQGERTDYFDYEGNSLRKAFLKAPLQYSRISSSFSNSRMHPVLKIRRPHHGVDYAASSRDSGSKHRRRTNHREALPHGWRQHRKGAAQRHVHHRIYAPLPICERHQRRLFRQTRRNNRLCGKYRTLYRPAPRLPCI